MSDYEAILEWNMSTTQAQAFRLAKIWEKETKTLFPEENHVKLPRKGDPRDGFLFKFCWKLLRETRGLLRDDEYPLYIHANLAIIKKFDGRVDPNVLCGDKAWIRWCVYKRQIERKEAEKANLAPPPDINNIPQIARSLLKTKRFLFEKFEGQPTREVLDQLIESGKFQFWVMQGKVCKYYLCLSSWVKSHLDKLAEDCYFDPKLTQKDIIPDVVVFFQHEFGYENEH